jgi:phosphatidylserine/phosphatidylglycerophosphate/cardiolipin synthase-like enzyme
MKPLTLALASALLSSAALGQQTIPMPPQLGDASVEVFFSPGSNADHALAAAIVGAKKRVWLAGYTFTSVPLAQALHLAHEHGVSVRVVLDGSQASARYSSATYFHNAGIPLRINARYPLMHDKFLLIDDDTVGFGSMNFTKAGARDNAENFNVFHGWPELAEAYAREFQRLERESSDYSPGSAAPRAADGRCE